MNYRKVKDRWVINKNGVFISLTQEELEELEKLIIDIKSGSGKFYIEDARRAKK